VGTVSPARFATATTVASVMIGIISIIAGSIIDLKFVDGIWICDE
jgi:hypothetical protein